jgi:hypothetical protein
MTYVQLQHFEFKYFRCYDPRKKILSSDTAYEIVGKKYLSTAYPLWGHNVKWHQCVGHNIKWCHYVRFHHGNKKNNLRWALYLCCNYYHIQCAHNHSTEVVVLFRCNLSICHIFDTSKGQKKTKVPCQMGCMWHDKDPSLPKGPERWAIGLNFAALHR